ncbi:MAG TPA: hypothetical protein VJI98_05150 [Candidatus Nanoarchaeia archaeon]|nr:hypothetical protein [Candidatus Nanoarchaeia archaeon]
MKSLFFDSGPIITLVMSRLDWILPELKKRFGGEFYITPAVKRELIDRPINIRRFEFEALQVMKLLREGVLKIYQDVPQQEVKSLISLANSSFSARGKTIDIIQQGELESVVAALKTNSKVVIDERTLRLLIENSKAVEGLLEKRFKEDMIPDKEKIKQFNSITISVEIIRSIELVGVAYQLGLLDGYIPKRKYGENVLVDAILWATKYNGCAVTPHEIEEIKQQLLR